MRLWSLLSAWPGLIMMLVVPVSGKSGRSPPLAVNIDKTQKQLQDTVTWDEHSLFIRGERVMVMSGEIHPFRIPVPSLYIDLFQKAKSLGLNTVSFYVDWALVEGKPGSLYVDGIFDLKPFFDAATIAGIYLIARPGPYINAEVSGGGLPGWLARNPGRLRTSEADFLAAIKGYMQRICSIIAKAQITNGGPVILFQPENEYTNFETGRSPDGDYMQHIIDLARQAGIVVPMISNDARPEGHNSPGTGAGAVDIYGHDGYPLGFDCGDPDAWPADRLPTRYHALHMAQSPETPFSLLEFQGGSFDPWGGHGFEKCAALVNHEYERVFYKNNLAAGVSIFSIYMLFGGTNWGNLGHPGGYTSYDYGAAIKEDRSVAREKFLELKLQAQFVKVSPTYLTAMPGNVISDLYTNNSAVSVTPLLGNTTASYLIVRHSDYSDSAISEYTLTLPTSKGILNIPMLRSRISVGRRDSKIHVVDYQLGNITLLYSTAEIYTWKQFGDKVVLLLYGEQGETQEMSLDTIATPILLEGTGIDYHVFNSSLILAWEVSEARRVVHIGGLFVYIMDRNEAYRYWVPDLPGSGDRVSYGTTIMNPNSLIVRGGYLVRSVSVRNDTLNIQVDFHRFTQLEIIGVDAQVTRLEINGKPLDFKQNSLSNWVAQTPDSGNTVGVPELSALEWTRLDSLPEIQPAYDDSTWPVANLVTSYNTDFSLLTPVSLFASDYGFHTGTIVFRGHFVANGRENMFNITTQGGSGFASSVWLNSTFVGSFANGPSAASHNTSSYRLPDLDAGLTYIFTILVDTMGLEENFIIGSDTMKTPRGILDYSITSPDGRRTNVTNWKLTGNLGGEDYADLSRGPLNEGGLFFERQGCHLPNASGCALSYSVLLNDRIDPGVFFYRATLPLNLPSLDLDISLSFVFNDGVSDVTFGTFRALLYVNGFQFGKYASNVGPQTNFPVPEGILRYREDNYLGLAIWPLEKRGAKLPGFRLRVNGIPVTTGRQKVDAVRGSMWHPRRKAY